MDPRRPPRTVIDPKIRQVGFFTSAVADPDPPSPSAFSAADLAAGSSISPVMIIPLRTPAVAVPGAPLSRDSMPVGSYNPSESLLGTSPSAATDVGSEFSEDVGVTWGGRSGSGRYTASSLPVSSGEMMAAKVSGHDGVGAKGQSPAAVSSLTTAAVVKVLPGVSEFGEKFHETRNEAAQNSSVTKQKLTKAERRAIQEAQRAAKAAAKETGEGGKASAASGGVPASQKQAKVLKPHPQKRDGSQATTTAATTAATTSGVVATSGVAASEKKATDRPPEKDRKKDVPPPRMQFDDKTRVDKAKRRALVNQSEARNRVELFRHLPQYVHGTQLPDLESKFFQLDPMHPSVYKVGLQYLSGDVSGGNARCIAMLLAFQDAIKDYTTPPGKNFYRDLAAKISSYVSFLIECRPLSISMGNAIKFLKNRIAKVQQLNLSELEAKSSLQLDIDRFISEKIILADKVIVGHAVTKIRDGDVLLVYGSSCVVEMILLHAHELGKQFRVVVVDSRPKLEGQTLLRRLVAKGIGCTYTHINALSYIMHEVSRVFLGASSVLSNGTVYSRVGTACVAMVAHAFKVPVLICCEAYKFHERVQLDSICSNELGNPDVISEVHGRKDLNYLANWGDNENLQLLNLTYDVTPSDYVSVIVTDYGMLPPTSVPVIVREYRRDNLWI